MFGPLTFKRGDTFLTFYAQPVWNLDEFNQAVKRPVNEFVRFNSQGKKEADPDAPAYREELIEYGRKRWGYLVLKSLEPSNIEFEKVSLSDPSTWPLVEQELKENLGIYEFAKVMSLVDEANALDEEKLEENAKSFFQRLQSGESPNVTPQKGVPANS